MSVVPSKNDVLFGRGNISATHEGNIKLRSIVESRKQEYHEAPWKEKKKIVISIIRQIQSMDPPGRFLQIDPKSEGVDSKAVVGVGAWVPVDEEKAASKVSHCLREKTKEKKGSHKIETNESGLTPLNIIFEQARPCIEESKYNLDNGNNNCAMASSSSSASTSASESTSLLIHSSDPKHVTISKELHSGTNLYPFNYDHVQIDEHRLENAAVMPLREWIKSAISTSVGTNLPYSASADGSSKT
ncbi:hypothetical protein ACHAXS_009281 [Conticribra weissflogii]